MERTNVTVSLPSSLVRDARHVAVDRGMSLSKLLATLLEEHLAASKRYEGARDRQMPLLERGLNLGIGDKITWTRESLHER